MALHRLKHQIGASTGIPVFGHRRAQTGDCGLVGITRLIHGTCDPQPERQRCFGFKRHIGKNIAHQRLVNEPLTEGMAVPAMVQRLHQRLTHHARRRHGAIEPVARHHINDGSDAAAFLPHHQTVGLLKFDLGRGVGAVTQFVLEPLDRKIVALTVRAPARHQKARHPVIGGLRQHQKRIAHGRGTEKLVSCQQIFRARAAAFSSRHGLGGIAADIRTPLLFRHEHPDQGAGFLGHRNIPSIVGIGEYPRQPVGFDQRGAAKAWDGGIGHRHRAHHPTLRLAEQIGQRRLAEMAGVAFVVPGEVMQLVRDRKIHQVVVRRMKFDGVNAHAVTVKGLQLRHIPVGLAGFFECVIQAGDAPDPGHVVSVVLASARQKPVAQCLVIGPKILVAHMRRHIGHLMGGEARQWSVWLHGTGAGNSVSSLPRLALLADRTHFLVSHPGG